MSEQLGKALRFRALHEGPGVFIIPNPWDVASAQLLTGLGFQALATSSAADHRTTDSSGAYFQERSPGQ